MKRTIITSILLRTTCLSSSTSLSPRLPSRVTIASSLSSLSYFRPVLFSAPRRSMSLVSNPMSATATQPDVSESNGEGMIESQKQDGKAPAGDSATPNDQQNRPRRIKKLKHALLFSYCGYGYKGLQRNPGTMTIEEDVLQAMLKAGVINDEEFNNPSKLYFQRAARTDKGVSAAVQVLSLLLPTDFGEQHVESINSHLPKQIQILGGIRVTKYFDSKNFADGRIYSYMMPTFALAPLEEKVTEDYRSSPDLITRFNDVLQIYKGTHNFHNFTSGKEAVDASAKRHILWIEASQPFIKEDLEWTVVRIRGQSFMLHQIRKMIGMAIAVMRGFASLNSLKNCFNIDKIDIPRAPGSGLLLEQVFYDRYNHKFGGKGVHEPISWEQWADKVAKFKEEYIYPVMTRHEKEEKAMFQWLNVLPLHTYEVRDEKAYLRPIPRTSLASAMAKVIEATEGEEAATAKVLGDNDDEEGEGDDDENAEDNNDAPGEFDDDDDETTPVKKKVRTQVD